MDTINEKKRGKQEATSIMVVGWDIPSVYKTKRVQGLAKPLRRDNVSPN
jgi:hypothetical protein